MLAAGIIACAVPIASASAGPFNQFPGTWSGSGTVRSSTSPPERIRCSANYRVRGSSQHYIDLALRCVSSSYNFDLAGQFQANQNNQVSGRWTERSRNIAGTAVGVTRGNSLQLHVETAGFVARVIMVTRDRRQSVTISSQAGGQVVQASITLRRG